MDRLCTVLFRYEEHLCAGLLGGGDLVSDATDRANLACGVDSASTSDELTVCDFLGR